MIHFFGAEWGLIIYYSQGARNTASFFQNQMSPPLSPSLAKVGKKAIGRHLVWPFPLPLMGCARTRKTKVSLGLYCSSVLLLYVRPGGPSQVPKTLRAEPVHEPLLSLGLELELLRPSALPKFPRHPPGSPGPANEGLPVCRWRSVSFLFCQHRLVLNSTSNVFAPPHIGC